MKLNKCKFIKWFIIITPFIDMLNGLASILNLPMPVSFGQVIRLPLLVILWFFLCQESHIYALGVIMAFALLVSKNMFLSSFYQVGLLSNISYDSRYFYVIIVVLLFIQMCQKKKISTSSFIEWTEVSALIISLVIIFCRVFDVGLTYVGNSKGLFMEVNSLTALLVWSSASWLYKAFLTTSRIKDKIYAIIVIIATLTQGTKTGVIGVVVCFLYVMFYFCITRKQWGKFFIFLVLGFIAIPFIVRYFTIGAGLPTLERWIFFFRQQNMITFLLSARNVALKTAFFIWSKDMGYLMLGTSYLLGSKLVFNIAPNLAFGGPEMDIFDIFYYYGLFAGVFITIFLLKPVKSFIIKMLKWKKYNYYEGSYIIILVISILGGHVLNSPMAGTFFAVAFVAAIYCR